MGDEVVTDRTAPIVPIVDPSVPQIEDEACDISDRGVACGRPGSGTEADDITEGDVEREVRRIGLPALEVRVEPATGTLVNVPTIFHTVPVPFTRSVEILGHSVDLRAEPSSFTWHHGDGTRATTSSPGRPYPAFDVTHRYRRTADAVHPSVDVTYRVTYRIDGGGWQSLSATITAPGPSTGLPVREAAPRLVSR